MKKTTFWKSLFLLCALIVGSTSVWGTTKTETFESKASSTTYNSTVTISTSESSCNIAWSIYYGCVSTNDKISDTNSAQMRWYSSATSNYPYIKTTTAIDGLTNVSLKARTSNTNVKMDVCYSTNGTDWTVGTTHTFSNASTGEDVSLDIPSGNKYVKFEVSSSSTAPSSDSYKLIVDDVTFTYSSSLEVPTWSVAPTSATVEMGESTNLQLTTNYDGTLSFNPVDGTIATVSYNSSTKVITITGVAAGTTTITASGNATSAYEAISKNIFVRVTHPELAKNVTDVMGPLGYSYYGLTPKGTGSSDNYAQPDVTSTDKTDNHGVTISWARNGSSNEKPRFDASYTRFYSGNTLTVTAPAGATLRKIVFTEPSTGKSWSGSMTTNNVGDYVSVEKTWYATTENVTSVVFTSDGIKRIGGINIDLMAPASVSINAACTDGEYMYYATYSNNFAFVVPGDLDVSEISIVDGKLYVETYKTGDVVPANTGVMVSSLEAGNYNLTLSSGAGTSQLGDENMLKATGTGLTAVQMGTASPNCKYYRLTMHGADPGNNIPGTIGYYWGAAEGAAFAIAANKAYLAVPNELSLAKEGFTFDDTTTGINTLDNLTNSPFDNAPMYNLAGQRVNKSYKGVVIVNGKKMLNK